MGSRRHGTLSLYHESGGRVDGAVRGMKDPDGRRAQNAIGHADSDSGRFARQRDGGDTRVCAARNWRRRPAIAATISWGVLSR